MTPQHLVALQQANDIRIARGAALARLADDDLTFPDALLLPECQTMLLGALLAGQHQWGQASALRALSRLGIGQRRRVCDLTPRQRRLVIEYVDDHPRVRRQRCS